MNMEVSRNTLVKQKESLHRDQLITQEDLELFKNDLLHQLKALFNGQVQHGKKWMKSLEVRTLLGISPGTLQTLRINGILPFTKMGATLYYDYEDIHKILDKNKVRTSI